MTDIDYAERVQRGIALLDEKWPAWATEIDLDTLDIGSGENCMTAQFYLSTGQDDEHEENWQYGRQLLDLNMREYADRGFIGAEYLADESVLKSTFAALNSLWKAAIVARRAQAQDAPAEPEATA